MRITTDVFPPPRLPIKAAFILRTLESLRPKTILEIGTGQSTIWFAAYAAKHGATVSSLDQNIDYQREWIDQAGRLSAITALTAAVVIHSDGRAHYNIDIPCADLIFVDGPTWKTDMGKASEIPKHLRRGMDVPRLLQRGDRPQAIIVDGRHATTDAIREATGNEYDYFPEFINALHKRNWAAALAMRGQNLFLQKR